MKKVVTILDWALFVALLVTWVIFGTHVALWFGIAGAVLRLCYTFVRLHRAVSW